MCSPGSRARRSIAGRAFHMRPDGTPAVSLDLSYARQHATRPDTRSRTRASTVGCCWGGPTPGEKHQWWRWPSRLGDSVGPEDIAIKHDPRRRPHTTRRASSMPISAVRSADEYRRDGLRGSGARLRPSIGTENNSVHYLSVSHYQPPENDCRMVARRQAAGVVRA